MRPTITATAHSPITSPPARRATLTKKFIDTYPDILRITSKSGYSFNGTYYNNTNHLLNTMAPYEGLDGFKTGTISAAGYCVTTTAVRNGPPRYFGRHEIDE